MPTSPNLSLPYLEAGQAQKHVTLNESLRVLDAVTQLAVAAVSDAPPAEPVNGERHIVGASPSGGFAGHANQIAAFQDGGWVFLSPQPGWRAWNVGAEALLVWTGSAWSEANSGGGGGDVQGPDGGVADGDLVLFDGATGKAIKKGRGTIDYLGVGAPPDTTDTDTSNRLVVKASRALFYGREEAETPGTGDIKLQISKEAEGNSASFFFSTNFSGRAEFGLVEGDAFRLKVSPDGGEWVEAVSFDPATGAASFREILGVRRQLASDLTLYVDATSGDDGNDGLSSGAGAFATIQKAVDTAAALDLGVYNVTIAVADGTYAPVVLKRCVGAGAVTILGNVSSPANVHLTANDSAARLISALDVITRYILRGFKLSNAGGAAAYAILASGASPIEFGALDFGTVSIAQVRADKGASIGALSGTDGDYMISGGATRHWWAQQGGQIDTNNHTVTLSGTPAYSTAFAVAERQGGLTVQSMSFAGSATGARFLVQRLGLIYTSGTDPASYLPGNAAGIEQTATGGFYT